MNIKLRFKNAPVLVALIAALVAFVYQICGIIGIVPPVSEEQVMQAIALIINVLVGLGILVDPTTKGITDSMRARQYEAPNGDKGADEYYEQDEDGDHGDIIKD